MNENLVITFRFYLAFKHKADEKCGDKFLILLNMLKWRLEKSISEISSQ